MRPPSFVTVFNRSQSRLIAELQRRGYSDATTDDLAPSFIRPLVADPDMDLRMIFGQLSDTNMNALLYFSSAFVGAASSVYDDPPVTRNFPEMFVHRGRTILVADLYWLVWNAQLPGADQRKDDYVLDDPSSIERLLNDLDGFGGAYIADLCRPGRMAQYLADLPSMRTRPGLGGKPRSVEPFFYSILLSIRDSDLDAAKKTLKRAEESYRPTDKNDVRGQYHYAKFLEKKARLNEFANGALF